MRFAAATAGTALPFGEAMSDLSSIHTAVAREPPADAIKDIRIVLRARRERASFATDHGNFSLREEPGALSRLREMNGEQLLRVFIEYAPVLGRELLKGL